MKITKSQLKQIIKEETVKEVKWHEQPPPAPGLDQEYAGTNPKVDAENSLMTAIDALRENGYTSEEIIEMVHEELEAVLREELWKVEYNKKDNRPAKGKKEVGQHTKEIEAPSAAEASHKVSKGDNHVVGVSKIEGER